MKISFYAGLHNYSIPFIVTVCVVVLGIAALIVRKFYILGFFG